MGISRSEIIDLISQLNEYVNEISGGYTLYLHQDASADVGGYLLLTHEDPDDIETDVGPFTITANGQELEQWATAAGEPGLTELQHGPYEVHGHAEKTAGTKDPTLYAEIYKRAAGGAETLLGTTEASSIILSADTPFSIHVSIPEQTILIDDRIVVKLFGNQEGSGTDPTISVYVEGDKLTRLRVPVSIGDIGAATPVVWRDPAAFDFDKGDLIDNTNWNDLDLSGIIGAGYENVIINARLKDNAANSRFSVRNNGNINAIGRSRAYILVANQTQEQLFFAGLDSGRIVEIEANPKPTDWDNIDISVLVYW